MSVGGIHAITQLRLIPGAFADIPATNTDYEGSLTVITDCTVVTGAVTVGGGTNRNLCLLDNSGVWQVVLNYA